MTDSQVQAVAVDDEELEDDENDSPEGAQTATKKKKKSSKKKSTKKKGSTNTVSKRLTALTTKVDKIEDDLKEIKETVMDMKDQMELRAGDKKKSNVIALPVAS